METSSVLLAPGVPKRDVDGDEAPTPELPDPVEAAFPIVGIGASAGGLDALTQLLKLVPADSGMAFVLIQHLDPTHPSLLREALQKATPMPVTQPHDDQQVQPNQVYVIPPDADMTLRQGRLVLAPRPPDGRGPHLPIDSFFRSLAEQRGRHAVGVVLSGNASDGTEGLRAIKAENGITLAQLPESAKFAEMPRNAINAGVVDRAFSIHELAQELVRLSRHPYVIAPEVSPSPDDPAVLKDILQLVHSAVGVDFSEYKGRTFERRMARRMALHRVDGLPEYLSLLRRNPEEVHAFYEDVLIHVTSFFRDKAVFEALETSVLPEILRQKAEGSPIRVWVAGCSTGEEVYSLGIALLDLVGHSNRPIQIFGSDLSEAIIMKARAGVYPDSALRDVSDERRRRYFVKTDRGYRINKVVRDLCVFVQHDLASDPPFSKLDLVSCRNVLIYFDHALQKRIIPAFHYCLNQPGYLVLGRTENISAFTSCFTVVDKTNKIFARSDVLSTLRFAPRSEVGPTAERYVVNQTAPGATRRSVDVSRHLDRMLLARYSPPGVLINDRMEVLEFRGQTGSFLQPASGEPQNDVVKMARPGLLAPLRAAIAQARKESAPVRRDGIEVHQDGVTRACNIVIFPLTGLPEITEPLYVVLFEDATAAARMEGATVPAGSHAPGPDEERRISRAENELQATKEYMRSLVEEHGRTNDDLGSANEELVSGNEELQSMNEELETAKEELQSTNEELSTVNDELHNRNQEVTEANSDLLNLIATVDIPIVIVDRERRIRRFTPKARHILNVVASDSGRPLGDIKTNIQVPELDSQVAQVISTGVMKELEVQDGDGHWYRLQIRPYKTTEDVIDGAILAMVDIDLLKHHVNAAQQARGEAEKANQSKDLFLAILGHELRTPLSSLLMRAQMLRRGGVLDAEKLIRMGEAIERGTRMQMRLVDDLMDVSRIAAGKLKVELRDVDLCTIIRGAIDGVSETAQAKNITLEVVLDETIGIVGGDSGRLHQIVSNLLTNAIKFTPIKGRVTITLVQEGGQAHIEVSDTGMGIEPAFLPFVFDRFSQEDGSNTRVHGGLGLGLAIVRHLVERHGGTVLVQSAGAGKGARFSVTLPILRDRRPAVGERSNVVPANLSVLGTLREYHQLSNMSILVVDDDQATREAISLMLREMGANVRVAESAAAAMAVLKDFRPRVLMSDIAMPGEDGYSFIRRVRALGFDGGGEVPALALTALAADGDPERALAAGFQRHLTKPVDIDSLSAALIDLAEPGISSSVGSA